MYNQKLKYIINMLRHKNSLESQIIDQCIVEFDIEKPYLCLVCINPVCKKCIK